ncbi:MAG: hypothetical protein Q4G22_07285 [Paracoccus sp. (in: a-proteobacteria)]|uniref:hypothetical protein n=1 Tax=Paracoccus sp. TaxID=267 RepID=UPI0026DECC48|nr:hypothetical protein [Paracoccus sp. (in: a-proteobacteria)]MDO5631625.1 hypothetical protein [Paracoccus sp. (in: a-proteobacteria)]
MSKPPEKAPLGFGDELRAVWQGNYGDELQNLIDRLREEAQTADSKREKNLLDVLAEFEPLGPDDQFPDTD